MRAALALLVVGLGVSVAAEPVRRTATVDIDGVEVRAGHALGFPAVGQLRKGDAVIIVRDEETGFFAILPPTGSTSWIKQIHLGKVEPGEGGKANVQVAVEGAEVMAGLDKENKPTNRVTTKLPKGTIVETTGPAVRIDNSSWYPIVPPDGDLRWVPKSAIRAASLTALAPPPPYDRSGGSPFTVAGTEGVKPAPVAKAPDLPRVLTDHRLWAQANQAEKNGDYTAARSLYARVYQDLWDQKSERDAIVICYNRYTRCDEMVKKGDTNSRREPRGETTSRSVSDSGKWSSAGKLQEVSKVFVDGKPVFAFQDEGGSVVYYVTASSGLNLRSHLGKRVQLYGSISQRPELYRPHMDVERVELAK
jgi:hypothetical protein